MFLSAVKYFRIALLVAGSAILLFSCEKKEAGNDSGQDEALMTEYSENLTIVKSENGRKEYHFTTPLLEGYTLARDPYREFRKGVHIVTYKDDSLSSVDATLTANYAIFYIDRNLWEAKGNVVVNTPDRILYTQQLFWNAKTKRIYSNVDTKIEQKGSRQVFFGEGIESDDALKDWRFRNMTGVMEVKVAPAPDSVAVAGAETQASGPQNATDPSPSQAADMRPAPALLPDKETPVVRRSGQPQRRESLQGGSEEYAFPVLRDKTAPAKR